MIEKICGLYKQKVWEINEEEAEQTAEQLNEIQENIFCWIDIWETCEELSLFNIYHIHQEQLLLKLNYQKEKKNNENIIENNNNNNINDDDDEEKMEIDQNVKKNSDKGRQKGSQTGQALSYALRHYLDQYLNLIITLEDNLRNNTIIIIIIKKN